MANLGEDPELERRLYCEGCLSGAHGKMLVYDHDEVSRLLDVGELKLIGQCVHCGLALPKPEPPRPAPRSSVSFQEQTERKSVRKVAETT